jgi:hypothetical protein
VPNVAPIQRSHSFPDRGGRSIVDRATHRFSRPLLLRELSKYTLIPDTSALIVNLVIISNEDFPASWTICGADKTAGFQLLDQS